MKARNEQTERTQLPVTTQDKRCLQIHVFPKLEEMNKNDTQQSFTKRGLFRDVNPACRPNEKDHLTRIVTIHNGLPAVKTTAQPYLCNTRTSREQKDLFVVTSLVNFIV